MYLNAKRVASIEGERNKTHEYISSSLPVDTKVVAIS